MEFGNSEQNFGMIASKFTVAMWYTHPDGQTSNTSTMLWFYYIITKIHPPFQNPGFAPDYWPNGPRRENLKFNLSFVSLRVKEFQHLKTLRVFTSLRESEGNFVLFSLSIDAPG